MRKEQLPKSQKEVLKSLGMKSPVKPGDMLAELNKKSEINKRDPKKLKTTAIMGLI